MSYPSETLSVLAVLNPGTVNSTPAHSGAASLGAHSAYIGIVALGNMANETIDARLEASPVSNFGSGVVTVASATQLAADASANDNDQLVIEALASDIARLAPGCLFLRLRVVTGNTTGGPASGVILGTGARKQPATHIASVVQVVRPA